MEHSKKYDTVKRYYDMGFWNIERVRNAVVKGWVTEEEFYLICQVDYEQETA